MAEACPLRRDPLSGPEIEMTLKLLGSVTRALRSVADGRRATGSDAALVREACHRLGSVVAAIARVAES